MAGTKLLVLGTALASLASAKQPLPQTLSKRDDPYPFCNPDENPNCILEGRYLVPILDWAGKDGPGDAAYNQYLPTSPYTLDEWTNGQWPSACKSWGVDADHFVASDFKIYNVTYPEQCADSPWVICYHTRAPVSLDDVATKTHRDPGYCAVMLTISRTYMVYSHDNPDYNGAIGTLAADGLIVGRSDYYFTTSLIHEHGHAVDSNLVGVDGGAFSNTGDWMDAINADYCAVSAYGAGSPGEDFAEASRAVLLDNIFPGGLEAFSQNNVNLTQISNQVSKVKELGGDFYVPGGQCDPAKKKEFPPLIAQE